MPQWNTDKPIIDREMIIITASKLKTNKGDVFGLDYDSWLISKLDSDEGWYFGLCDLNGDEWGAYDDLSADLYYVIELPKQE